MVVESALVLGGSSVVDRMIEVDAALVVEIPLGALVVVAARGAVVEGALLVVIARPEVVEVTLLAEIVKFPPPFGTVKFDTTCEVLALTTVTVVLTVLAGMVALVCPAELVVGLASTESARAVLAIFP